MQELKADILAVIKAHGPLRARQIARYLEEEGWTKVYTFTINPILYGELKGQIVRNDSYEWSLQTPISIEAGGQKKDQDDEEDEEDEHLTFGAAFSMARRAFIKLLSPFMPKQNWGHLKIGLLKDAGITVQALTDGKYAVTALLEAIWTAMTLNTYEDSGKKVRITIPADAWEAFLASLDSGSPDLSVPAPVQFLPHRNFFRSVKATIHFLNLPQITTYFTDTQAVEICSRMASG